MLATNDERIWALLDTSAPDEWVSATLLSRGGDDTVELLTDSGQRTVLPATQIAPRNSEEQDCVACVRARDPTAPCVFSRRTAPAWQTET